MKKMKFTAVLLIVALLAGSCGASKTVQGGAIGAGSGAAAGAIIGALLGKGKGAAIGAAIGTAVGGGAGAIIGNKMDKKAKEAAAINGAQVSQVTDANGLAAVQVTFDSGILFAFNSSTLSDGAKSSLSQFAKVLREDPTIDISIIGHTDKTGTYDANKSVSTRRANAVSDFLRGQGVSSTQIKAVEGVAYDQYNEALSAAQNRRVEVYMYASAEMIRQAEAQAKN